MNKRTKYHWLYALVTLSLVGILAITSCSCSNSGYKQITVSNELGSYSFEYPSYYDKDIQDNLDFWVPYTYLVLLGPERHGKVEVFDPDTGEVSTVSGKWIGSSITVTISNYKVAFGESCSAIDKLEDVLKGEAKWANYQLLERAPLTVSDVEGEMVIYLVDKLMPIPVENGENLEYVCAVYFDYNNFTWEIVAKCDQDIKDQVKADFDHIIQTFIILE